MSKMFLLLVFVGVALMFTLIAFHALWRVVRHPAGRVASVLVAGFLGLCTLAVIGVAWSLSPSESRLGHAGPAGAWAHAETYGEGYARGRADSLIDSRAATADAPRSAASREWLPSPDPAPTTYEISGDWDDGLTDQFQTDAYPTIEAAAEAVWREARAAIERRSPVQSGDSRSTRQPPRLVIATPDDPSRLPPPAIQAALVDAIRATAGDDAIVRQTDLTARSFAKGLIGTAPLPPTVFVTPARWRPEREAADAPWPVVRPSLVLEVVHHGETPDQHRRLMVHDATWITPTPVVAIGEGDRAVRYSPLEATVEDAVRHTIAMERQALGEGLSRRLAEQGRRMDELGIRAAARLERELDSLAEQPTQVFVQTFERDYGQVHRAAALFASRPDLDVMARRAAMEAASRERMIEQRYTVAWLIGGVAVLLAGLVRWVGNSPDGRRGAIVAPLLAVLGVLGGGILLLGAVAA